MSLTRRGVSPVPATGQVRAAQILDAIGTPRHMPQKYGPASTMQVDVSQYVNARMSSLRPDLTNNLQPADVQTVLGAPALDAAGQREAQRFTAAFLAMSDADLGRVIRHAQTLLQSYFDRADDQSTHLMEIAVEALIAAAVGTLSGRRERAIEDVHRVRERFDRQLLTAVNGEMTVVRAETETFVKAERERLTGLVGEIREQLVVLAGENELVSHAADQAQRDATALQRELDGLRGREVDLRVRHAAELEALRAELRAESETRAAQLKKDQDRLAFDRRAFVARERALKEEIAVLTKDKQAAQLLVGTLNAELESLSPAVPLASPLPRPEAHSATEEVSADEVTLSTPLDALSLARWLRGQGRGVLVKGSVLTADGPVTEADQVAWAAAYPDAAARRRHLREGLAA